MQPKIIPNFSIFRLNLRKIKYNPTTNIFTIGVTMSVHEYINQTLENIKKSSPGQTTFLQAATEVLHTLEPLLEKEKK